MEVGFTTINHNWEALPYKLSLVTMILSNPLPCVTAPHLTLFIATKKKKIFKDKECRV
jgi:hypothetical protein